MGSHSKMTLIQTAIQAKRSAKGQRCCPCNLRFAENPPALENPKSFYQMILKKWIYLRIESLAASFYASENPNSFCPLKFRNMEYILSCSVKSTCKSKDL